MQKLVSILALALPLAAQFPEPGGGTGGGGVTAEAFLAIVTGAPNGAKVLRDDLSWVALAGGGDALVASPLSQFAATNPTQLASVLTGETGTGAPVFGTSPSFTTDIRAATAGGATLGTAALPFSSAFLGGSATNNFQLTGTATAARVVTIPDVASATMVVAATSATATQALFATTTAGAPGYRAIADADIPDTITASNYQLLDTQLTTLSATPTDDAIPVGSGTDWVYKVIPDCVDTGGNHLNYTAATNAFSCGTSGGAGGGAPTDAQYVTLALNGTTTAERVLTPGTGLDLTDAGANGNVTLDLDTTEISNTTFGPGTDASIVHTIAVTGTDPVWTYTASTATLTGNLAVSGTITAGDGTTVGESQMNELAVNGTNYRSWLVPDALTATLRMRFPNTVPTAGQVMLFGAPSTDISEITFGLPASLAANGANCSSGNAPLGVDASGAVESCFDVLTQTEGDLKAPIASPTFTGTVTLPAVTTTDNVRITFNPGATASGLNVGAYAGDPSTPVDGDIHYDSAGNGFRMRINGAWYFVSCMGDPAADGIVVRNALCGTIARTLTGTADEITVTNGTGVVGNPTISLPSTIALGGKTVTGLRSTVEVEIFSPGTAATTGDGKAYFRIPASLNGMNLTAVNANVYTAGTTGTISLGLDRCVAAATGNVCSSTVANVFTTNFTIDSGENSTSTAAAAGVIDTANDDVATGQLYRFNIDTIHTTPSQGMIVELTFQ